MNLARTSILGLAMAAVFSAGAGAQGIGNLTAGIYGGVSIPSGDFKDEAANGWHAGALVKMRVYAALDARVDGIYNSFGDAELVGGTATVATKTKVTLGTFALHVNLGPDSAAYPGDNSVSPHLVGGVGIYRLDYQADCTGAGCVEFEDPGIKNHFGLNFGGGATFPLAGLRTFIEARYHRIARKASEGEARTMLLISAGLKIR